MKEEQKLEEVQNDFFVVGIGASAGGLDAIQELFDNLPNDTGMAFVIVQHLSANFKSLMDELLAKHTKMPIHLASNGIVLKPNNIYLNPSNNNIICKNGKIVHQEKEKQHTLNLPIDIFFHSIGNDLEHRAIGVILSGTGTDGSRGIATIKEAGGTILVQDPGSAQFDGMPITAINSNLADYILTPGKIGEELIRISDRPKFKLGPEEGNESSTETFFNQILDIVYKNRGIDFKQYKPATLIRRIEKRMTIRQITQLKDYLDFLKSNNEEKELLFNDFLIGVTTFFRDPQAFAEIKAKIFPQIFVPDHQNETVRLWVVACSTGEEAYSLAILVDEFLKENKLIFDFKIFATDVDPKAIQIAGLGRYPVNLCADISDERLEKYFIKTGSHLEVVKSIREKIVFSNHNILRDPPFIKIDFVSCRNLLIYMKNKVQRKILLSLQFGLKLNGFMFLGNSENLGEVQNKFEVVDTKWRLYKNISDLKTLPTQLQTDGKINAYNLTNPIYKDSVYGITQKFTPEVVFNRHIAEELAPACIYIDRDSNVLFVNGNVNDFLKIGRGFLQQDLFKMLVSDKLTATIRNGIRRLKEEKKTVIFSGISFENNDKTVYTNIRLQFAKIDFFAEDLILIVFSRIDELSTKLNDVIQFKLDETGKQRLDDLENELKVARQETQNVIEELETSNEELQASNEELQASNEELQSTNEELQSVNEELYTVNSELQAKNKELKDLTNDFSNLFNSTNIAMLFLDEKLRIRKFTPELRKIFRLEENDINRPIENFASNFINVSGKDLAKDAGQVIRSLRITSKEVIDEEGNIYLKRIIPFMVNEHKAEGALITFVDITEITNARKEIEAAAEKTKQLFQTMVEAFALHEIICDDHGTPVDYIFLDINAAFEELTGLKRNQIIGKKVTDVLPDIKKDEFNWIERYGKVALTCTTDSFENYTKALDRWYTVKVFSPEYGKFAVLFSDISERKKYEENIKASEEKFRNLFETMTQGVVYQNASGEIISVNPAAERILGLSFEQMTGRTSTDIRWKAIHEDGNEFPGHEHPAMVSLRTGKEINNVIMGVFHPGDNSIHWLNINSKPLFRDNETTPYQVYATFEDITFERNALLTINQNRKNLELAQNVASMSSWEIDLKTGQWFWPERFYNMCGLQAGTINPSPESLRGIIHPDDISFALETFNAAIGKKEGYSFTLRIVMPDKSVKTILSKGEVLKDNQGVADKLIGIFIDISDQIKREAEINKLYKAFLQSPTPNVLADKNGIIEFVNNALCELTGYEAHELVGKKASIFKSGKHPDEYYQKLWADITHKKIWQGELINKKKNGQFYYEYATISPIFDNNGKLVNFIKVAQDMTEQVELKLRLEQAKQKAEEADKLKSSFLANMSHEIRTPMNSIIGFAQILNESDLPVLKRKEYIDIINSQGEYLLTLINDIIDISKVEINGIMLREETCNVDNLILELQTFFAQNKRNSIDIRSKLDDTITNPVIKVDATRLRQVLTNLIGNAVKFTTNGYVEFGYTLMENNLRFYVKDTGIGIPGDKREKVFDRFYQIENPGKESLNRGTGLGLAISKALVNLMGGNIWVDSEEFVGSTFYFTIPYNPAVSVEKPRNVKPTSYKDIFSGKKVLIAEDIESNFMFLDYALAVTGVKIVWAKNGMEAIEKFKTNNDIDLILMDINMPILDGYEATRKIKQINPNIPVIAQTAYAMESDKEKVLAAGCNDYLSKPIKVGNLVDMINKYIGMANPAIFAD